MFSCSIDLPEPFAAALAAGRAADVADVAAETAAALYGRAQARIAVGRDHDARSDLNAAATELADACRIELAWLDLRAGGPPRLLAAMLKDFAAQPQLPSRVAARAWHVCGLAWSKALVVPAAVDALLQAAELYHQAGDRLAEAQVYDTLGSVEADRGRLDNALHFYAMSLVDKALLGDRPGMALTLGNIGRVHLRAGRFDHARSCFQRDLEIATVLGDERGQARMLEDLGRASLGLGELVRAEQEFRSCLTLAERAEFEDLRFFAHKDLVLTHVAQGKLAESGAEFERLRQSVRPDAEPFPRFVLSAAEGELLAAQHDPRAVEVLEDAADGFQRLQLPDLEIPARLVLARALTAQRMTALAEKSLLRGIRLARADGYMRYLPILNEAMAALELVEGAMDETARAIETGPVASESSYIVRERLGVGAFGEVFRAYDAQRCREVAVKRLKLQRLYDVAARQKILASARAELEAASRVRHPGIVRVLALGTEPDGGEYIVQEFVTGRSLRASMPVSATADPLAVLHGLEQIADALAALHAVGVVHRDLKPENVIVRPDGSLVLVDFGIAHIAGVKGPLAQEIAGTLDYMAPEQAAGQQLDGRAELYALGVIGFEWLTGTRPLRVRGQTFREVAQDLAARQPPPIFELHPQLDEKIAEFVMSLLAKKPGHRPATAGQAAERCRGMGQRLRQREA
ncbi:MAG: protein kinase [Planctomycetia bacterium]|nr:protein kinase [Planctomycetia bacterium]